MKKTIAWLLLAAMAVPGVRASDYTSSLFPEDIYVLEERLAALGYMSGTYDNIFDANTVLALQSFQMANGLEVTGEADDATLNLLNSGEAITKVSFLETFANKYAQAEPLSNGSTGAAVTAIQKKLKEYGYFIKECDGLFGDATESAVERFQMANGIAVTGVADGSTQLRLFEGAPIKWNDFLEDRAVEAGDSGLNVYALQKKLLQMGYFQGDCTASFGDVTRQAVIHFQEANGLEPTGAADAQVWQTIYSGNAIAPKKTNALQIGDSGETVQKVQNRLGDLGYYSQEADGVFGMSTETAVRLFQMGNGLTADGEVGEETLNALNAATVKPCDDPDVQATFRAMLDTWDPDIFDDMARIADSLLGSAFDEPDEDLYPGFSFVQYVAVAAGLPVTAPEILMRLTDQKVESGDDVEKGNIIAFQVVREDRISILLGLGLGDGRFVYATDGGGWVVVSYIDQMDRSNVYRWGEKVDQAQ